MFRRKKSLLIEKPEVDENLILGYIRAFMPSSGLTHAESLAFSEVAKQFQLNPYKKEIYCVPYMSNVKLPDGSWDKERKLSLITGYQVYLQKAEASGKLVDWKVTCDKTRAYIKIWRSDRSEVFEWDILISEYDQQNKFWKEKRETMAKTVVIGQGFRMCFPNLLGGMPYTREELPDDMTVVTEVEPPKRKNTPKRLSQKSSESALEEDMILSARDEATRPTRKSLQKPPEKPPLKVRAKGMKLSRGTYSGEPLSPAMAIVHVEESPETSVTAQEEGVLKESEAELDKAIEDAETVLQDKPSGDSKPSVGKKSEVTFETKKIINTESSISVDDLRKEIVGLVNSKSMKELSAVDRGGVISAASKAWKAGDVIKLMAIAETLR